MDTWIPLLGVSYGFQLWKGVFFYSWTVTHVFHMLASLSIHENQTMNGELNLNMFPEMKSDIIYFIKSSTNNVILRVFSGPVFR